MKWFSKLDVPKNCFTACDFCHRQITETEKGLMLKTAQFFHWVCLLKLKDEVLELERKLNQKRE